MKFVVFSSSSFAIPIIERLLSSGHTISLIVTTPERKRGRGQKIQPTEIRLFAAKHKIPLIDPEKLNHQEVIDRIGGTGADYHVIASYGKLVPKSVFTLPQKAPLNVHPSLLPRHRGASPIQAALLSGDSKTGVSIADVISKLDAGDLFGQVTTEIHINETAADLSERLSKLGADLLLEVISKFESGGIARRVQKEEEATYAGKIDKHAGLLDWTLKSDDLHNRIRAFFPWPSAYTFFNQQRVKVLKARLVEPSDNINPAQMNPAPGNIIRIDNSGPLFVATGDGAIALLQLQLEGRRSISASEFARGLRLKPTDRFENNQ